MRDRNPAQALLLCILVMVSGAAAGILAVRTMSGDDKAELISYLDAFVRQISGESIEPTRVFSLALGQNMRSGLIIYGLGLAVIGVPAVAVLLFVRGFAAGFSSAFVITELSSGLALFGGGMLLHMAIAMPSYVLIGKEAMNFSTVLIRERPSFSSLLREWVNYTRKCTWGFLGLLLASLVEAYISPLFISRVAGL